MHATEHKRNSPSIAPAEAASAPVICASDIATIESTSAARSRSRAMRFRRRAAPRPASCASPIAASARVGPALASSPRAAAAGAAARAPVPVHATGAAVGGATHAVGQAVGASAQTAPLPPPLPRATARRLNAASARPRRTALLSGALGAAAACTRVAAAAHTVRAVVPGRESSMSLRSFAAGSLAEPRLRFCRGGALGSAARARTSRTAGPRAGALRAETGDSRSVERKASSLCASATARHARTTRRASAWRQCARAAAAQ